MVLTTPRYHVRRAGYGRAGDLRGKALPSVLSRRATTRGTLGAKRTVAQGRTCEYGAADDVRRAGLADRRPHLRTGLARPLHLSRRRAAPHDRGRGRSDPSGHRRAERAAARLAGAPGGARRPRLRLHQRTAPRLRRQRPDQPTGHRALPGPGQAAPRARAARRPLPLSGRRDRRRFEPRQPPAARRAVAEQRRRGDRPARVRGNGGEHRRAGRDRPGWPSRSPGSTCQTSRASRGTAAGSASTARSGGCTSSRITSGTSRGEPTRTGPAGARRRRTPSTSATRAIPGRRAVSPAATATTATPWAASAPTVPSASSAWAAG